MISKIAQKPQKTELIADRLLARNRWDVSEIGLEPQFGRSERFLNFTNIRQPWLCIAVKKFIRLQAATKTYSTCASYLSALNHFSSFLSAHACDSDPIDRNLVVNYIHYLSLKRLSVASRKIALFHLRTFHTTCIQEDWLSWPNKPLVFQSDFPKSEYPKPRHIPDTVINQLKQHLPKIRPNSKQRLIIILLETGRRISEICTLPYQCLEQDHEGDWYLKVNEKKFKKKRLIPISHSCLEAIREQQKEVSEQCNERVYLFPSTRPHSKMPHVGSPFINQILKKIAHTYHITDDNGEIWDFQSHQFRHTVGTNMINSGVPQIMVQNYLGHETSKMTERYAHIHNETLKKAFFEYQNNTVNIRGDEKILEAQWIKENIASQTLPNGLCALPLTQKKCPHANACLTCVNFRTSKKHLSQHKEQLNQTLALINNAKQMGWQRIEEMNTEVAINLTSIIKTLESKTNE